MLDLAPRIHRQRLVVEATVASAVTAESIADYLKELSTAIGMVRLMEPVTHKSPLYGWAGWVHWETSGAHIYAWDDPLFISVDIYACKSFSNDAAVALTREHFACATIVSRKF
jgi:hypothetical protein